MFKNQMFFPEGSGHLYGQQFIASAPTSPPLLLQDHFRTTIFSSRKVHHRLIRFRLRMPHILTPFKNQVMNR